MKKKYIPAQIIPVFLWIKQLFLWIKTNPAKVIFVIFAILMLWIRLSLPNIDEYNIYPNSIYLLNPLLNIIFLVIYSFIFYYGSLIYQCDYIKEKERFSNYFYVRWMKRLTYLIMFNFFILLSLSIMFFCAYEFKELNNTDTLPIFFYIVVVCPTLYHVGGITIMTKKFLIKFFEEKIKKGLPLKTQ
jgi:hypothetical protein